MLKLLILFIFVFGFVKTQQQSRQLINALPTNPHYINSQSNVAYLSQLQPAIQQPQFIPVTVVPEPVTLFPTISPNFLSSMFEHPHHQHPLPSSGSDSSIYGTNRAPTPVNYAPAVNTNNDDFTFAPGTLPMPCGYGVNPVPVYNSPFKKCIPNSPLCGLAYTCIFNIDSNGKPISRAFGPNQDALF